MIVRNRILAGLDQASFGRLAPYLDLFPLPRRAILQDHCSPIEHVYFVESGVASLYARTRTDGPVEIAVVGRFGLVGVSALLQSVRSPHRCLMQVPGQALRIAVSDLRNAMDSSSTLRQQLLSYVNALLVQNSQTALCNGRHDLDQRLCRWLLLAADRLDGPVIPVTHDMLAMNLGVRRAGVTGRMGALEDAGFVATRRGRLEILDRPALQRRVCECYVIIASEYRGLTARGTYEHVFRVGAFLGSECLAAS